MPDRTVYLRTWTQTLAVVLRVRYSGHYIGKLIGKASSGRWQRGLGYTGASLTLLASNTGQRHDLPRHLGSISARLIGFVASSTATTIFIPPLRSNTNRAEDANVREMMMMAARQSLLKSLHVNASVLDRSLFANVARHSI